MTFKIITNFRDLELGNLWQLSCFFAIMGGVFGSLHLIGFIEQNIFLFLSEKLADESIQLIANIIPLSISE